MHIPARYYKRIPKFYFIVGILLVISSFNMEDNELAAFLYFISGVVSVIYAISVHQARKRGRKNQRPPDDLRPVPVDDPRPGSKQQPFVNDNTVNMQAPQPTGEGDPAAEEKEQPPREKEPALADQKEPAPDKETKPAGKKKSKAGAVARDLPKHGSRIPSPGQSEVKP